MRFWGNVPASNLVFVEKSNLEKIYLCCHRNLGSCKYQVCVCLPAREEYVKKTN